MFQNLILFKSFDRRLFFFFHSFHQLVVFEKTHNCKSGRFHGLIGSKKWLSESKTFIKVCFVRINSISKSHGVQNIFFRNMTRSKIFDSNFVELWKNGSKSEAFEILDSKYDPLYKKWFKNWLLSKSFIIKNNFFRNNLSKNGQKRQLWRF